MTQKRFTVHKTFLEGAIKGMIIAEQTDVLFTVDKTYGGGWTGPRYKVTAFEPQPIPAPASPEPPTIPQTAI
jgi:hypothetical protein